MARVLVVLVATNAIFSQLPCATVDATGDASMPRSFSAMTSNGQSFNRSKSSFESVKDDDIVVGTIRIDNEDAETHRNVDGSKKLWESSHNNVGAHSSGHSGTLALVNAALKLGSVLNATSTIEQTYVNWLGNPYGSIYSSRACWRKAHIAKMCPLGYNSKLGMCWTQCPYSYPLECGLECIRQNDDCGTAVFYKVAVVVQTAISLSAWSIYGDMEKWDKGVKVAIKCIKYMISIIKSLVRYIRYIKVYNPEATKDKILSILYQIDNVIIDLPVTVAYCIGKRASDDIKFVDTVLTTAEYLLYDIISNGDFIISTWKEFMRFMKKLALGDSAASLTGEEIKALKSALKSNTTCGYDLKRLLDRTWMTVAELRLLHPEMSEDEIRVTVSQSNLMLNDIPIATNNCIPELLIKSDEKTAYATRDTLRKTFETIVDDLITAGTSNNGSLLTFGEYAFKIADRAIGFYAIWDYFYVSSVISQYVQPICAPTLLIGEIDDGNVKKALAMTTVQGAFNNSDGMWTKVGDGTVTITFKSIDVKDVAVNIKSGGDKIAEVPIPAGKTVVWKSTVAVLGGKTLYLDRWRPGFLNLPGTGGGSLRLWVPRSALGGTLQLTAFLNANE
ncbi:uncharacterized protein CCR75_008440 [Bremia lactucae]|uniref:Uncharacterized protein n=1 Tax=Bremia lactucae TaxID=4779 RepID=A0A976IJU9_BRELC|nr:hypothetical protein CCR75_008440 [Bremia lactucae]